MSYKDFFRKLLNEQAAILESVNVFIPTATETPKTIYDISSHILFGTELNKFLQKNLSKEDNEYFQNNRVPELFTIDGVTDMDADEGVINFYTAGLSEDVIEKLNGFFKYYIGEYNGILMSEPKREQSNMFKSDVIRYHVKIDDTSVENPPSINLSNMNASLIFSKVLNYPSDIINGGSIIANELLIKVENALDNDFVIQKAERKDEQEGNRYMMGYSADRIRVVLGKIKEIAEYAIENNHTHIHLS